MPRFRDDAQQEEFERRALLRQMEQPQLPTSPIVPPPVEPATGPYEPEEPEGRRAQRRVTAPPLTAPEEPMAPETETPTPTSDYSTWGQYGSEGTDHDKIARGHDSPKYQIARVLSHFDSKQGLTPEVIAALNALGIGTFSANKDGGDFLRVSGDMDPRFEGVTGSDIARDLGTGNWQGWGGVNPEGPGVSGASRSKVPAIPAGPAVPPTPPVDPPGQEQSVATRQRWQAIMDEEGLTREQIIRLLGARPHRTPDGGNQ